MLQVILEHLVTLDHRGSKEVLVHKVLLEQLDQQVELDQLDK